MLSRFRKRSYELEHLDIGDYSPAEYEGCIVELQRVNRWLGDARALRGSLIHELENWKLPRFSVLDIGAGSGELLRVVAEWAREQKRSATLVGLELNERSARAIRETSVAEIFAVRGDAFRLPFDDGAFDYVICSLFTHHFREAAVVSMFREMDRVAAQRLFVIDLHRHPVAYYFYITVAHLFLHNRLIREDGALSILRSFTPRELSELAREAGLHDTEVKRSFPYRIVLSATAKQKSAAVGDHRMRLAS